MDTIKDSVNKASSALTSESSGREPVSGEKGAGTVSEPYDQGNAKRGEGATAKEGVEELVDGAKNAATSAKDFGQKTLDEAAFH